MKTPILNVFIACILCLHMVTDISALSATNPEDSLVKKRLLASSTRKTDNIVVLKEANVVFPEIFQGNEAQSIDYIEKFSVSRKNYLIRTHERSKKLFPKAAGILKKHNVPEEFKILLALESGFNADAVSPAGAVGYWQIMDEVAMEYGMKIQKEKPSGKKSAVPQKLKNTKANPVVLDERKNFLKSTHVAARYLKDRCRNLNGDWLLIAASYNWGVGNVWNAMEKTGKAKPTFWDINKYLPSETRAYVMNFIAMNVLLKNYEKFLKNDLCFKPVTCKAEELFNDLPTYFVQSL